jgi:uncharacterized RDD family membrane protein YckC
MPPVAPSEPDRAQYPGERLGLPESGRRSVARFGRRLIALIIDWWIAVIVTLAVYRVGDSFDPAQAMLQNTVIAGVFVAHRTILTWVLAGSVGQLLAGVRVVPVHGGVIGWWRPVVRSALIMLVIPAIIWDRDQRGLHDRVAGTVLVRK